MTTRERVHQLIDQMPDDRLSVVLTLLLDLEAEEDDEPLTPEDIAAIEAAKSDPRPGISTEELCQKLGLSPP